MTEYPLLKEQIRLSEQSLNDYQKHLDMHEKLIDTLNSQSRQLEQRNYIEAKDKGWIKNSENFTFE